MGYQGAEAFHRSTLAKNSSMSVQGQENQPVIEVNAKVKVKASE